MIQEELDFHVLDNDSRRPSRVLFGIVFTLIRDPVRLVRNRSALSPFIIVTWNVSLPNEQDLISQYYLCKIGRGTQMLRAYSVVTSLWFYHRCLIFVRVRDRIVASSSFFFFFVLGQCFCARISYVGLVSQV